MSYVITTKGLDLLASVQADPTKKIEFVRAEIGNGKPEDVSNPEGYTSLIGSIIKDAEIQNKEVLSDESVKIAISYNNEFVETGFTVHEAGLYVKDPDDDTKDFLFLYCNSNEADFLPDNTSTVNVEQVVNLIIKISNSENVTVNAASSSNVIRENFGDNTILKADVAGAPVSLEIDTNTILGRKGSEADQIEALTPEEARNVLNTPALVDGKISYEHNNISNSPRQAILSLNDISFKTSNVKIADEHSYVGNGQVRELDFGMDFVTQDSQNQYGGMAFGKIIDVDRSLRIIDTDMNDDENLYLNDTIAIDNSLDNFRGYTENGVKIGTHPGVNGLNQNGEFFAFQTTKKEQKKIYKGVKSVVFRCHNTWDSRQCLGIRRINFYNDEIKYNMSPSDYTAYATSINESGNYLPENTFNSSLSLTGDYNNNQWLTPQAINNEQLIVIVFNSLKDITHIDINNSHHSGTCTDYGVKDLEVIFTDQTLDSSYTVWDTAIPNGETVWSGRLSPHAPADAESPQTIMFTPWRYNPNNGFAFQTRIGRSVAERIKNPPEMDGMKLCFRFSKNIDQDNMGWNTFSDKIPSTQGIYLNLSNPPETRDIFNNDEDSTSEYYSIGYHSNISERGKNIKDYCFFGKDLSYIESGLTGVEGATAFMKADPSQTFECGFEPQMIIVKALEKAYKWRIYTKDNGFQDVVMSFSDSCTKTTEAENMRVSVNGTKITAPSASIYGKYLIIAFAEVVSVPAENKVINTLAKSSPGTLSDREVDMGMDFVSDENGGMVLTKGGNNSWVLCDTVRGPEKCLFTNIESSEVSDQETVKAFLKNGVKVGNNELVNGGADQFYMGFQTDEKVKPPEWKAKSVIFDIESNYGSTEYIRLRSIEFYKDGVLFPLTESDFVSESTTTNVGYESKKIFITGRNKTGVDNGYRSGINNVSNQRITIVFNNEIEFDKIVINNGHDAGTNTISGAQLVDIQITDHSYSDTTYGAVVTGSANRIFRSNIHKHPDSDETDDKIYVDISDEWQINRASGFGMCKIKGTGANRVFRTPFGKEVCMMWLKKINVSSGWTVYFHALGVENYLRLDTTQIQGSTSSFHAYLNSTRDFSKEEFFIGIHDPDEYMIYAWFGDYYMDDPTGIVNSADDNRVMGIKGTTAFFTGSKDYVGTDVYKTGIDDIETVIWKRRAGGTDAWNIINRSLNNFQDRYWLDQSEPKKGPSGDPAITINGSEITMSSSSYDPDHFIFMVFGRSAEKDRKDYIPWMNQVNHIGTGSTDTHIDLGLDFTEENGGMILQKSLTDATSWVISDTLRGVGKQLHTDATNAESTSSELVKEFTDKGVKVGTDVHINKLNSEIATFGFQTTHKTTPIRRKVKSAIFKFADTWGGSSMGIRRIEFFTEGSAINIGTSEFNAYAKNEVAGREAKYAFLTVDNKTGDADGASWYTGLFSEQVLIINFASAQYVDYIRVNNFHNKGAETNFGVKNVKVYFTDQDYTDTSYSEDVPNSELVYDGIFDQHYASDSECYSQYLYTPWHYNPQTGFGFFTHKGNGTEITIPNVFGKQPTMLWCKNVTTAGESWVTYSKIVGDGKHGSLNTTAALTSSPTDYSYYKEINNKNIKFGDGDNSNGINADHITYVWVGDDMATLGNLQETYGVVGTTLFTEKKAANAEIELGFVPELILVKSISATGGWCLFSSSSKDNVFDSYVRLDLPNTLIKNNEGSQSNIWLEGTTLKFGTDYTVDHLVCAFAKNTYKPQGKSIVIHGSESYPSLFSIANGFNKYQAVDKLIGYDRNVVFNFNEGDGTYYIKLNINGTITLKKENCFYGKTNPNTGQDFFDVKKYKMFSPSGSVTPGIYIGKIVIQNDAILDVQKFQEGVEADVDWFPVSNNSMYIKDNPFFTTETDWDIWWNSVDTDENMRHVTGQYYTVYNSGDYGMGAYKRINSNEIIVGTGRNHTFYSGTSGDPVNSNSFSGGYYKLIMKRRF